MVIMGLFGLRALYNLGDPYRIYTFLIGCLIYRLVIFQSYQSFLPII